MGESQATHPNQRALILTLTAAALETVLCTVLLLRIPSDSKNAFLFGLSKERLLMTGCFAGLFLLNILAVIFRDRTYKLLSRNAVFLCIRSILAVSLFFFLLPDYRFGRSAAYFSRLRPFVTWIFLTSLTLTLYCRYDRDRFGTLRETIRNILDCRPQVPVFFAIFTAAVLFTEITGLGKTAETALWNKNGIPLQSIQLFFAILVFFLLRRNRFFAGTGAKRRLLRFLLIWAVSALIWSRAPFSDHFFAPGPYDPDLQYFPYSDAITYDISTQTALHGWGFNLGRAVLKPALAWFTCLIRLITKNDYNLGMLLQSAVFAILPAIIFLFGEAIGGTGCGYLAAAFSLLKEWNALNTHTVLTIHSRLTMSEFFLQIIFAAFCYGIFRWLRKDGREILYAVFSGGMLTLGMFTRYNFMAFLPAALLILGIAYRKELRKLLKPLLFFMAAVILTAAPMMIRDTNNPGGMIYELKYTITRKLIGNRFDVSKTDATAGDQVSAADFQNAPESENARDLPENEKEDFNRSQITQQFQNIRSNKYFILISSMINHSMHNMIASALTLPMEVTFHDLEHLYQNEGDGLWRDGWEGNFSLKQWLLIGVWLLLFAAACGILVRKEGIAAVSILYFWAFYAFSIGFSRSSGGRYVVPCNWIPMLLLAFLLTVLADKGKTEVPAFQPAVSSIKIPVLLMVCFTMVFTSMALFERFMPAASTAVPEGDLAVLKEHLADADIDWEKTEHQINEGSMRISHGIVLYPRFYYYNKGEHTSYGPYEIKDYSRLVFQGINREGDKGLMIEYLLPHTELINNFPRDSVYRAISCRSENGYDDVLAVTVETPNGETFTYMRDPLPEFACPVPEPVCSGVNNCR